MCLIQAYCMKAKKIPFAKKVIPDNKANSMQFVLWAGEELTVYNV